MFFFSSRRRHTRYWRDWSSDVCSSDLAHLADELEIAPERVTESTHFKQDLDADSLDLYTLVVEFEDAYGVKMSDEQAARVQTVRSEERRVEKECRSRWSPYH